MRLERLERLTGVVQEPQEEKRWDLKHSTELLILAVFGNKALKIGGLQRKVNIQTFICLATLLLVIDSSSGLKLLPTLIKLFVP